jgi:penicillin-binding protein 1A
MSGTTRKKRLNKSIKRVRKAASVVATTLAAIFLVAVITVCIVAVALTVYVMQFAESSFDIDLDDVQLTFSSFVKGYDAAGNEVEIKQLSTDENRVWVDIDDMPIELLDAVVSVEDKRFFEHDGVDWTRTVGVVVNALINGTTEGGSTITQQLVRDVTGDNDVNVGRKLREIFRALTLEQKYTKMDILESYLNRISFGGTSYGVGSAAKNYFNKDVKDLTLAECAILAGIIRSPSNYNPYANLSNCRTRQVYALKDCLYDQGVITTEQYEQAMNEKVQFRRPVLGDNFGYVDERYNAYYGIQDDDAETIEELYYANEDYQQLRTDIPYKWNGDYEVSQTYYTDACINQVTTHLAQLMGISEESAREQVYKGGLTIYSNENIEMQKMVEAKFSDPSLVLSGFDPGASREDLLQAAFVIMDYHGRVLAISGGLGEKEGDNAYNRATQSVRAIGSTIKPLSVYGPAINNNLITYSTEIRDISGQLPPEPGQELEEDAEPVRWPYNYEETTPGSGLYYPTWFAVMRSLNTIAVRVLSMIGKEAAYDQLELLGFSHLDSVQDMSWSPLALGQLTNGATLTELAAAYQIYGNGGVYYEPYYYSKVVDSQGNVILEQNLTGTRAVDKDAAWVVNRMMRKVIEDESGSGRRAKLSDENGSEMVEVVGKTGTANDETNLLFVGLTPDYVGAYRIGYDEHKPIAKYTSATGWKTLALVWHDVMIDVVDMSQKRTFTPESTVLVKEYCTLTGLLATSRCPDTRTGYYRQSNIPESCDDPTHDNKTYWTIHGDDVDYIPLYD